MLRVITRYIATAILALALVSCSGEDSHPHSKRTTEKQATEKQTAEIQTTGEQTTGEPPPAYVSLGDSLAVGVGASDPRERSYAALYRDALAEEAHREVRFVQLGVSGETSESFIGGYPQRTSSQLARAETALERYPGATVTLSLGANDLLRTADGTNAERGAAIARYGRNLDFILKKLRSASDPEPRIAVLALYNPAPGSFTDEWVGRLNAQIRAVATTNGASVAAGDRAFRGHETEYVHYPGDIHPTDEGYAALARAFERATGVA